MSEALWLQEIDIAQDTDLSRSVAAMMVSELIDHNPDTQVASTAAYIEQSGIDSKRHFVLMCGRTAVGAASIRFDPRERDVFFADGLVISEQYRGNDYGRILLGLTAQQAHEAGARGLKGGTWIPSYFAKYGFSGDRRNIRASVEDILKLTGVAREQVSIRH